MAERNIDFDLVVDRHNTHSLKYDFHRQRGKDPGLLPLWVADMDFKVSSYITDALESVNEHGIFGYSESGPAYFEALKNWMATRHGYNIEEPWLVKTPGVVFALAVAIKACTNEGDAVLIQEPVYYPFKEVILANGRIVANNDLKHDPSGRYSFDFNDFEAKIIASKVKLFILCSPHNPVGRVWKKEELARIGEICLKHGVKVFVDEIHSDFVFEGKHHVFTTIDPAFPNISIIATAPSKTFNIAGLQVSNILIEESKLREAFNNELAKTGYSQLSLPALVACETAYLKGHEWLDSLIGYLSENYLAAKEYLAANAPEVTVTPLEGTYLLWLDLNEYNLTDSELVVLVEQKAGLWLDDGLMFGESGRGFVRINIACPRSVLLEALSRLCLALPGSSGKSDE